MSKGRKPIPVIDGRKLCPKCGVTKLLEDFSPDRSKSSGRSSYCKVCRVPLCVAGHRRNPEPTRRASERIRKEHPERWKEIYDKHVATGKKKASEDKWKSDNIVSVRLYCRNRRALAKIAEGGGAVTKEDIERIMRLQKGKCAICRSKLPTSYHMDHITSLAKGGAHESRNIQLTCGPCNQTKHAQDPMDFMRKLGRLL